MARSHPYYQQTRCAEAICMKTSLMAGLQLLIFCAAVLFGVSDALRCASCTNATDVKSCQNYVNCRNGERCYSTSIGIGSETLFDLGCKSEADCFSSPGVSVIGRSIGSIQCSQCCAVDNCNTHLCSAGTQVTNEVGNCADDPTFDCQHMSTLFNICGDVAHAKTACRKWCGLCDLVDGAWSTWTSWSNCDVTCGLGHVTRTRSCTDPSPAHGGLTCSGNSTEGSTCTLDACPIHGGWSSWKSWSSCSHTCSIGTQSRHRACDNPVPAIAGNHCFGESVDFQACFERSCADGGWSTWSQWTSCTDGMNTRNRSCDSPSPSQFGRYCVGSDTDTEKCYTSDHIAFTVNTPNGTYIKHTLIFTHVVTNLGGGFNTATGRFTCTIPGLYFFTLSLDVRSSSNVYCNIYRNSNAITYAASHGSDTVNTVSASTYLTLIKGDEVYVGNSGNVPHISPYISSSFSGALV